MYYVSKKIEIAGSHRLTLDYESKCSNLHGHNWNIEVFCKSKELNKNGMVVDFAHVSEIVKQLDHQNINDILPEGMNPTAENIAHWLYEQIPCCYKVSVQESNGNIATFEEDKEGE